MRWTHGADGTGSPSYCESCKRTRGEPWQCAPCTEPQLWPQNLPIVQLWLDLQTQWRVGFAGPTGLDYTAARALMPLHEIADERAAMHGLRLMEGETLKILADQRKKEKPNG